MSQLQERIAQFRKMANDDPDNVLAHFSLGKALLEVGQFDDSARSFRRVLALDPNLSKADASRLIDELQQQTGRGQGS